jgi:hypothetical protein
MATIRWLPHRGRAAAALAMAVLLAGCGLFGGDDGDDQPPQDSRQAQGPLATVRGDVPGLVLSAGSLKREGGVVTLRFTVTNHNQAATTLGDLFGEAGKANTSDAGGVYLYDGAARKRYDVVRDGEVCRCSKIPLGIEPGQAVDLFASFRDLPAQTGEVSAIVPHFAPLDGLRIQA